MRVLLIEDDGDLASYVIESMARHGHSVEHVATGDLGLQRASAKVHDVLIVDRMLPQRDGLGIVTSIRKQGNSTPVIFLTAVDGVFDRVQGLEAGGDDYLVKPFAMVELLARVNALSRRPSMAERQTVLVSGDLRIDRDKRTVFRGQHAIELQPREFRLLEYLMCYPGQIITRAMLLQQVWDFDFDPKTTVVETVVSRLRTKLSVDGRVSDDIIETVRGAGYRLRDPLAQS